MREGTYRLGFIGGWLVALVMGCSSAPPERPVADDKAVREKFTALQSAIEKRDADALWELLDAKSRADADRVAKDLQTAYANASPEEKAKQEESLGLKGSELAELTGKGFLKSKRFQKKYDELPASKIEKVTIQGDNATVNYLEPDGDHEKAILVRQEGQWKAWLTMPKGSKAN